MIYRHKGIHSPASTASGELYFSILRTRIYFQLRIFSTKLRLLISLVFAGSEVEMFRLTERSGKLWETETVQFDLTARALPADF